MKRAICVVGALLMLFGWVGGVAGQNFGGIPDFPGESFSASVPGLGSLDVGGVKLTGATRVGYQRIGLNFNLPTLSALGLGDGSAPIDIQLRDARVWVGSVGVEAQLGPRLSLFANGEANGKKTAAAVTSEDPLRHVAGLSPYRWNASGLEWWALEGGVEVNIGEGAALFAGLRRDHLSFRLDNPVDQFGNPINNVTSVPGIVLITDTNAADFQLKLWVPYVGLRVIGTNYRGSVIWSPFVNAAVKIPDSFAANVFVFPAPAVTVLTGIEWKYSMFQLGALFEGELEYEMRLSSNLFMTVWAKGSWLRVRGKGNLDEIFNNFVRVAVSPPIEIFTSLQDHQSATATLSRSLTAVGLAAKLEF